ncbi:MAG: ribosome assembly RNA-binding protein YhbY [Burkholderiales bacterium]|nr:ribosome assembly RNA-binding protein YhbY [Burkholderiales bacterium]
MELTRDQRLHLRAQAHGLQPVVMIGANGLTEAVIREIAVNLDAHELIKVRVLGDDREQRAAWYADICEQLECAPVQQIGKLLVLYRPTQDGKSKISLSKPSAKAAKQAQSAADSKKKVKPQETTRSNRPKKSR